MLSTSVRTPPCLRLRLALVPLIVVLGSLWLPSARAVEVLPPLPTGTDVSLVTRNGSSLKGSVHSLGPDGVTLAVPPLGPTEIGYEHIVSWKVLSERFYHLSKGGVILGALSCTNDDLTVLTPAGPVDISSDIIVGNWAKNELKDLTARVTTKDGSVICGDLRAFDDESVTIKTPFAGDMVVPHSDIESWETDGEQLYALQSGARARGKLAYSNGRIEVVSEEETVNVSRDPIEVTWQGREEQLNQLMNIQPPPPEPEPEVVAVVEHSRAHAKAVIDHLLTGQPYEVVPPPPPPFPFPREGTPKHEIAGIVLEGDKEVVDKLRSSVPCWDKTQLAFKGSPVSDEEIAALRQRLLEAGQQRGYVFFHVQHDPKTLPDGILTYRVKASTVGQVQVAGNRHYSDKQITKHLDVEAGDSFNYTDFRENVKAYSAKPDVRMDVTLEPKRIAPDHHDVDMVIDVDDKFPLHGSIEYTHGAREAGSDRRVRTTIEHLNVTKADDQASVQWVTDPANLDDINAVSASYRRPIDKDTAVTVYGGWSEADLNDVLPELDVQGKGHFTGLLLSRALKTTPRYRIDGSVGFLHQSVENALDLANVTYESQTVRLSLPTVSLSYADRAFDRLRGRNVASLSLVANFAGSLGSSDEDALRRNMPEADGNFLITKAEFARLQQLADTRWSVFGRLRGQYTDATLVPALQKAVGGADELRGYVTREITADSGVSGTLELRTPLLQDFIPGMKYDPGFREEEPRHWSWHQLQLLTFFDFAYMARNDPMPGQQRNEWLRSTGLGMRLALSPYSAVKFDYGVPLKKTDDSERAGRGYLSLQLHF